MRIEKHLLLNSTLTYLSSVVNREAKESNTCLLRRGETGETFGENVPHCRPPDSPAQNSYLRVDEHTGNRQAIRALPESSAGNGETLVITSEEEKRDSIGVRGGEGVEKAFDGGSRKLVPHS